MKATHTPTPAAMRAARMIDPEVAKHADEGSVSCQCQLEELAQLIDKEAGLSELERQHEQTCLLVSRMYCAVTGSNDGPHKGVLEDIWDVMRDSSTAKRELLDALHLWARQLSVVGITQPPFVLTAIARAEGRE